MRLFRRNPAAKAPAPSIYEGDRSVGTRVSSRGHAMMDGVTKFYRNNPKTVGGIALLGAAALLGALKHRGLPRA